MNAMTLIRIAPRCAGMTAVLCAGAALAAAPPPDLTMDARNKVALEAAPFGLAAVRLLEGPFRHAQALDHAYLLSLDPDRLLHTFRLNAGLPSLAEPLGGWEEPKGELRGHFVGHYLTACALMYASTGDEKLNERVRTVVAGLAECQARFPSGYLSAFPEEFFDRVESGRQVWAPYYTLHKIFAGLLDAYQYCGNTQALEVCTKFGDWAVARNRRLSEVQMQSMLGTEHGGINEALANLYAATGDEKYLSAALRFNHQAVIAPAAQKVDRLTGLHANTQIPKFVGTARQYALTGDESLRTASRFFWDTVVRERSYVIGGHSDGEHFTPKERLSTAFGPSTTETCNTYNMLKLTRHLFCWEPRVEYADYYERALYNHILASQNPKDGMTCYYVPLRPGSRKDYSTPLNSFWCCTGTGIENHAKYGDSIYFHSGESTLYVNLFIASELSWPERGLKVRQETEFPLATASRLVFTAPKPVDLEVRLRRPSWATSGYQVAVNGQPTESQGQPGSWVTVRRTWMTGDTIAITMPFDLHTEGFADNPNRFAFLHGPLVLGAEVLPGKPHPAVVAEAPDVLKALAPGSAPSHFSGSPAVFRIPGGQGGPVMLEPFYAIHDHRHYVVYFERFTPAQWIAKESEYAAELARQREIATRTVDFLVPDREQSERDHALQGDKTAAGDFGDRKWRHATDGGWFSWQLKALPDQPQELWVTYWGSDGGNRVFDVLVDGQRLATQRLEQQRPESFFDEVYPIPAELLKGKKSVTVRFQAQPGCWAGGVFGVRIMKTP